MKIFLAITFTCLVSVLIVAQTAQRTALPDLKKLEWLLGEWNRIDVKPGRSGSEKWALKSDIEMEGWGTTMKGADTIAKEKLKLVVKGNDIFYVADVAENKEPVYFKLTLLTRDEFICENPEHNFPKKISYKSEDNKLKATISGNGKSMSFLFERVSR